MSSGPTESSSPPVSASSWAGGALPALDAVRAVATIGVIFVHVGQVYFSMRGVVIRWAFVGDAGVQIFFVLSGYLITTSVLAAAEFDRRNYARRRLLRIVPLYYVSIAVALLVVDSRPLFTAGGRADVLAHLVFLHGFAPGMRYSINGVWWTLTVEVTFYILIAILGARLRQPRWCLGVGMTMVVLGPTWRALAFQQKDASRMAFLIQQLPGQADLFGVGMLLAYALTRESVRVRLSSRAGRIGSLVASGLALVAVFGVYYDGRLTYVGDPAVVVFWPLALALAVAGSLAAARVGDRWLQSLARWSGLAFVGTVSYGVYLFHPFVMLSLSRAWFVNGSTPRPVVYGGASLAGATLLAAIFHYSIERPAMRWGRTQRRASSPAGSGPPDGSPVGGPS